ncbi:hypothetical protein C7271_12065 [filamentous cyanobacterium CCP5]|nr:hypothetical protein C7271_12065 [filamentous cyanobacterium CCP5]
MDDASSQAKNLNIKQPHHSDGSELVPAEVQANERHGEREEGDATQASAIPGSTLDDEGLINNFAVEPKVYPSEYPSPRQQRQYIYWGIAAVLLVSFLVAISTFVS